ncbi:MAG: EsaB/YukD family protein [Oscillospiraceae bacterium]|nr:EsaB/YukD family protein [Oscillospiraceae bacterium]
MKKYLVDVYLPADGRHYDVYLPTGKQIGEATQLLVKIVESQPGSGYKGGANSVLLYANNGEPLDRNLTVYDAGIRNSTKLILI